jgi:hypothetical protein
MGDNKMRRFTLALAAATVATNEAALTGNRPVQGPSKVSAVLSIREVSTLLAPCTEGDKQPCTS